MAKARERILNGKRQKINLVLLGFIVQFHKRDRKLDLLIFHCMISQRHGTLGLL